MDLNFSKEAGLSAKFSEIIEEGRQAFQDLKWGNKFNSCNTKEEQMAANTKIEVNHFDNLIKAIKQLTDELKGANRRLEKIHAGLGYGYEDEPFEYLILNFRDRTVERTYESEAVDRYIIEHGLEAKDMEVFVQYEKGIVYLVKEEGGSQNDEEMD